jgi:hypothetical protein
MNAELKNHYLTQARYLINWLKDYKDQYSIELRKVLRFFVENPVKDLADMIDNIKLEPTKAWCRLYCIDINCSLSEILYPENEFLS